MDWQRAKWILIISFALVNIYLFFIYAYYNSGYENGISSESVKDLQGQGITVAARVPKDIRPMKMLKVHNRRGEKTYRLSTKVYDVDSAKKLAQKLLDKNGIGDRNTVLKSVYQSSSDSFVVRFGEVYRGYYVDTSYIYVYIYPDHITVRWSYLTINGTAGKEKSVINGVQAVYSVLGETGKLKGTKVTHLEIGYYFTWDNATSGEAIPAWKLVVDGRTYYVNAYTGNVETK
ncbi:two-component system regulatory protein YycI [Caldanaerobius polysaccharolyticus]|uniref:two-component system regulatory protein YycI n=1 Tax=Caldanaerobius polysaccharolyticus TaxID=44256 RepID=UPI00047953AF|nr:two-component system regulatory protein YycI [Caldanaerobius polysaccharolyticus]